MFQQAAKQGHPDAMLHFSERVREGKGCQINLDEARALIDRAFLVAPTRLFEECLEGHMDLAGHYLALGTPEALERSISILLPWAHGRAVAQMQCGMAYQRLGEYVLSRE